MSCIRDKNVVLTGIIPGYSRGTAQARLQELGARVQASMSASTEFLIVGGSPGPVKQAKAEKLGIVVISWENAVSGVTTRKPSRTEALVSRVVSPQLALAGDLPHGSEWIYEIKWDGYRCIATISEAKVSMQSRSGRSEYLEQFPLVAEALSGLPNCILDGELIILDEGGVSNFETVHSRNGGIEAFMVFDILEFDGRDMRSEPLWLRREAIVDLIGDKGIGPIQISPSHDDGEALHTLAIDQKFEGVVAKRRSSRYIEGSRTEAWIKVKVRLEQEFVVLGWKPGEGSKAGSAGSILVGVRHDGRWQACGRVGTGRDFSYWEQFTELTTIPKEKTVKYDLGNASAADLRGIVWVSPTTVVQVRFQRWTADKRLWHPSLQGIRKDKKPMKVVRET